MNMKYKKTSTEKKNKIFNHCYNGFFVFHIHLFIYIYHIYFTCSYTVIQFKSKQVVQ